MGLDLAKLQKVKHHGSKIIARCPACAEEGGDRKGEHLFIEPGGRFGCVVYPGIEGHNHRQHIFELTGIKDNSAKGFKIRRPLSAISKKNIIQKDILGHLGHMKTTHARSKTNNQSEQNKNVKECEISVPAVPEDNQFFFTPNELEMLRGIDLISLKKIDEVKRLFNGIIMSLP